jgi:hypothetical protein
VAVYIDFGTDNCRRDIKCHFPDWKKHIKKMIEKFLFDGVNRAISWVITIGSGTILWIGDIFSHIDSIGKAIITLCGIIGGLFVAISYYWQFRKNRAECKKIEFELKEEIKESEENE